MSADNDARDEGLWELFPPARPTGVTHVWWVDPETNASITAIFDGMEVAMSRGDTESYGILKETLLGLPGHPKMAEGDHIEVRVKPRLVTIYSH